MEEDNLKEIEDARETENLKKVEAAFFISGKWMSMQELVSITDLNPILLRQLIDKLSEKYSNEDTAIKLLCKDDRWKMDVGNEYTKMVNRFAVGSAEFSRAEQETLAVIAYKQPVKQSVIIKIRGNKAYEHIKNFISLDLVRAKKSGHTKELNLSEEFYDYFSLEKKNSEEV